ncbi:Type II secretion system (T2SS), protein F [Candidatus Bilamarchaeum dharawalense]|uniref:Type II secretion system (T2SS), protein F n=1 Tax=Candidatus Bilamarchaeum dharawalense TaxID=2885759 RepID=A0A5E4LR00_9ARCH|nr:Type II secretion system (T2SS), protein F [Candidatus Bilamarchaeum dharawalense]
MEQFKSQPKKKDIFTGIAEMVSVRFPDLKKKLKMADINETPTEFLEKLVRSGIFITVGLVVLAYLVMWETLSYDLVYKPINGILMLLAPLVIIPPVVFFYLMLYPDAAIMRRQKEMDYEIVFAGRHIVIALKSGMPLFDTFVGASTGYGAVSTEFRRIVDQVTLGVPVTQAIRDVVQYNPSKYFTRILMQITNSLSSGSDLASSLESVIEQISKEQMISLKEYSQKLTPIVMFYMVFGIIVPSLGVVLATVVFSAISGGVKGLSSVLLVEIFLLITVVQFLFLGFVESSRPKYLI